MFQTRGKKFSSGVWKSKVRMLEGLIVGMNFSTSKHDEKNYPCMKCDYKTSAPYKSNLREHQQAGHMNE